MSHSLRRAAVFAAAAAMALCAWAVTHTDTSGSGVRADSVWGRAPITTTDPNTGTDTGSDAEASDNATAGETPINPDDSVWG